MNAKPSPDLVKTLAVMAELYGKLLSREAAELLVEDLAGYPEADLSASLSRCRKELKTFPSVSEIIARINDGRPGVEEAWGMCPKDESSSVVWTNEMRDAFSAARALIDEDPVAARMAFKERYIDLCAQARASKKRIQWDASLGHDKQGREYILSEAVQKGRLTEVHASRLLPDISFSASRAAPRLSGPTQLDAQKLLTELQIK